MFHVFNQYIPTRRIAFVLFETVFITAIVVVVGSIRSVMGIESFISPDNLFAVAVIVAAVQLSLYYFDLYDLRVFRSNLELGIRLLQALGVACIALAVLYYLFPDLIIEGEVFIVSLAFLGAAIVTWRYLYNRILKTRHLDRKVLIVGNGPFARNIAREVSEGGDTGFEVAGFITASAEADSPAGGNPGVIGSAERLLDIALSEKVDRIVVALEERRGQFPLAQLLECKMRGIQVQDGVDFYEHLSGKLLVERLHPSFLIFSEGFRVSRTAAALKRVFGFALSAVGIFLALPLIIIIAAAVKLDSPGPVFYMQERVGRGGRVFGLLKFRSMVQNAEAKGPQWADEDDPRITRVGRFIRKWRLDEIPQMINVFGGDMAFVGPRPERPHFVEMLSREIPYFSQRHAVKPGITGWAQINYGYGASKADALEKLKWDLYYVKNLSFTLDLYILFQTIKIVLFGRGAR